MPVAGNGTRFSSQGNKIDRIKSTSKGCGVFLDMRTKQCTGCNQKKSKKGGTNPAKKGWLCADCKNKQIK